jgi:16S rRNA G966 N2-methylase RsmD
MYKVDWTLLKYLISVQPMPLEDINIGDIVKCKTMNNKNVEIINIKNNDIENNDIENNDIESYLLYEVIFIEMPYIKGVFNRESLLKERKKIDIYCQPSEVLFRNASFLKKYREHFDVVFFSPPYYRLELYKGGQQSTDVYKTYEEWLAGYWEETIKLCYHVLQKHGQLCYILSGYGSENTKEQYDLLKDMNAITKKYFRLKSSQPMYNKDVHSTDHKETNEKIVIFRKE